MKIDYLIKKEGELSTYFEEKLQWQGDPKFRRILLRVENRISESASYQELARIYEIKPLDPKTGLKEIKADRLGVMHLIFRRDTVVLLGVFMKKTQKTPQSEIDKNNKRISEYLEQKHER